jgi:hypothetical protein
VRRILCGSLRAQPEGARGEADGPGLRSSREGMPRRGDGWRPFIMATVNTRVVRRSNALLDFAYGRAFSIRRVGRRGRGRRGTGSRERGRARAWAMSGLLTIRPPRKLATRFLPAPGEGPSREQRERGVLLDRACARSARTGGGSARASGRARIPVRRDVVMALAESALCSPGRALRGVEGSSRRLLHGDEARRGGCARGHHDVRGRHWKWPSVRGCPARPWTARAGNRVAPISRGQHQHSGERGGYARPHPVPGPVPDRRTRSRSTSARHSGHGGHEAPREPSEVRSLRDIPLMRRGSGTSWQPDLIPTVDAALERGGVGLDVPERALRRLRRAGRASGDSAVAGIGWLMLMAIGSCPRASSSRA